MFLHAPWESARNCLTAGTQIVPEVNCLTRPWIPANAGKQATV